MRWRKFALSPSQLCTFAFVFCDFNQQVSVDFIERNAGTVSAKGLRLIHDMIGTLAVGHSTYEC